jgi:hypothetical protein
MKRWTGFALLSTIVLLSASSALAVRPATWIHNTEAQFSSGKFDCTVSTSLGEIRLARGIKVMAGSESCPAVVSCIAKVGDTLFAGAGDEAVVYRLDGGKLVKHRELPAAMIACMTPSGDGLLVGTGGGEKPGLWRLDGQGKSSCAWSDEKVKYVWAIEAGQDGGYYVATGPEGKVFAIDRDGHGRVIYDAGKLAKNVLCLAAGPEGKLYAGTGDKGLILEIDPKAKTGRVLYDPAEKEVAALLVAADGSLLAATSDASKAGPDGKKTPATTFEGKADKTKPAPASKPDDEKESAATAPAETTQDRPKADAKAADAGKGDDRKNADAEKAKPKAQKPKGAVGPDDLKADEPAKKPADGKADGKPGEKPTDKPTDGKAVVAAKPQGPAMLQVLGDPAPTGGSDEPKTINTAMALPPGVRIIRVPARPDSGGDNAPPAPAPEAKGNAVYRVQPDGLVETIFRRPVTILAMAEADGRLILATGNGGGIYGVSPDGDEVALIADTDAKQVTCLEVEKSGEIVFGTANKGSIARLAGGLARKGAFVSQALDAQQIAKWGTMQVAGTAPAGTHVTIATRSGNVGEPDEQTWSTWSKEVPLENGFLAIGAPAGRFLQYRLSLSTKNPKVTPSVSGVQVVYQVGNLHPTLAGVNVTASEKGPQGNEPPSSPKAYRHVDIKALDQNGDKLRFEIAFREIGSQGWIVITDDLMLPKFIWDTRGVGDGTYELRIEASDDPSNPAGQALSSARISEPVVVDNTAPVVGRLSAKPAGEKVIVAGQVEDTASRVAEIEYSVNSQDKWHAVGPSDGICDSNVEKFSFDVEDLKPGTHRIAVRATDIYGNVGYGSVSVRVGK